MKINPRIYDYADEENKVEAQELEGHNLEIYYMDDYPGLKEEFVDSKGKFAVWSSVNGKDYRLYIEKGYHEKLQPLYTKKINGIWLNFWDECEKISNKFRIIVLPITIAILVVIFLISYFVKNQIANIIAVVAIAGTFLIGLLAARKISNKKFADANKKSVDEIKKYLGEKTFERLLEEQRSYMDEYFKYEDETSEEEIEKVEATGEVVDGETIDNKEDSEAVDADIKKDLSEDENAGE